MRLPAPAITAAFACGMVIGLHPAVVRKCCASYSPFPFFGDDSCSPSGRHPSGLGSGIGAGCLQSGKIVLLRNSESGVNCLPLPAETRRIGAH